MSSTRLGLYDYINLRLQIVLRSDLAFRQTCVDGSENAMCDAATLASAVSVANAYRVAHDRIMEQINRIGLVGTDATTAPYCPTATDGDDTEPATTNPQTGFNCSRCNERNDHAAANQSDGTYVCYRCR